VERGANQADEDEVIEMAGLKCCVLAVVSESEELPACGRKLGLVHPLQHGRRDYGGCGASAFRGERGQSDDVLALRTMRGEAAQTEAKHARQEEAVLSTNNNGVKGKLLRQCHSVTVASPQS